MLLRRLLTFLQSPIDKILTKVRSSIEKGNSLIGVPSKRISFRPFLKLHLIFGNFSKFEQPFKLRISRESKYCMPLGRLVSFLHQLKSRTLRFFNTSIDESILSKLLQLWRISFSKFDIFEKFGNSMSCLESDKSKTFNFPRHC